MGLPDACPELAPPRGELCRRCRRRRHSHDANGKMNHARSGTGTEHPVSEVLRGSIAPYIVTEIPIDLGGIPGLEVGVDQVPRLHTVRACHGHPAVSVLDLVRLAVGRNVVLRLW